MSVIAYFDANWHATASSPRGVRGDLAHTLLVEAIGDDGLGPARLDRGALAGASSKSDDFVAGGNHGLIGEVGNQLLTC
ncbi:MAG: hypothetical protein ACRD3S_22830 [Terracidiphilus sp.]